MQKDDQMKNLFYLDILNGGKYPYYSKTYFREHNINLDIKDGDLEIINEHTADFVGMSYYNSMISSNDGDQLELTAGNVHSVYKNPHLDANEWGWQIDADGLRYSLVDFYHRYYKPLFIVENGIGIDETMKDGKVYDDERIAYYQKHIKAINTAVEHDGVDLMGYLAWSPIDFLSSHKEIRKRYGFVYVDRDFEDLKELKRYPKKSFYWYKKVIESQGKDLENDIDY